MTETIKAVIITTAPSRGSDPGSCEIGHYFIAKGFVVMCDEAGKTTGARLALNPGDDPERVAGRLLRAQWLRRGPERDGQRKLVYRDMGIA